MSKKIKIVLVLIVLVIVIISVLVIVLTHDDVPEKTIVTPVINEEGENKAPSKLYSDEVDLNSKKALELFKFIPKIYVEDTAPFSSNFMLNAVMKKIMEEDKTYDYTTKNVDNYVTKIFGKDAKIEKEEVSQPNVQMSLFYYSKEAASYAVIPVGYEGIFEYQILKNATETTDAYYVYTYGLIGGYAFDEQSINRDEFGDISYENAKVQVIVGDKDGKDLIHVFDNYSKIYDENIWIKEYANLMPVFRYTLKKDGNSFYLTEVEQISY